MKTISINSCGMCPFCNIDIEYGGFCKVDEEGDMYGDMRDINTSDENPPEWCPLKKESIAVEYGN